MKKTNREKVEIGTMVSLGYSVDIEEYKNEMISLYVKKYPKHAKAIELFGEGYTQTEIADMTGKAQSTISDIRTNFTKFVLDNGLYSQGA